MGQQVTQTVSDEKLDQIERAYRERCARFERTLEHIIERDGFILAEMKAKNGDTFIECTNAPLVGVGNYCVEASFTIDRFLVESARFDLIKDEIERVLAQCKEAWEKGKETHDQA